LKRVENNPAWQADRLAAASDVTAGTAPTDTFIKTKSKPAIRPDLSCDCIYN